MSDDPMADLDALGLGGDIDLSDPLAENKTTMSELEKYIKQVIKEAKNPLAQKMREVEIQGRTAALETKLAAIAEMIEETEGRLTRIDEDNEFRDMMDKGAVKEVRKQLKELERAQAKLQKEYDKVSGGRKKEKVVDELDADGARDKADNLDALADKQDALDQEAEDSMEEVSFELNESTLNEIDQNTVVSAIRKARSRKEFARAEKISNMYFRQFYGKEIKGEILGKLVGVQIIPGDIEGLYGQSIRGIIEELRMSFRNDKAEGQEKNVQVRLNGMRDGDGEMTISFSGAQIPIEEQPLSRQEVRFIQNMINSVEYKNATWGGPGSANYNVGGLRESILRMQKLAGLITESDIKKKN